MLIRVYFAPFSSTSRHHLSRVMLGLLFLLSLLPLFLMVMQPADSEGQLRTTVCDTPRFPFSPSLGIHEAEYYGPCNSVFCIVTMPDRPRQASTHKGKRHLNSSCTEGAARVAIGRCISNVSQRWRWLDVRAYISGSAGQGLVEVKVASIFTMLRGLAWNLELR